VIEQAFRLASAGEIKIFAVVLEMMSRAQQRTKRMAESADLKVRFT
jgi:hypothetical protein